MKPKTRPKSLTVPRQGYRPTLLSGGPDVRFDGAVEFIAAHGIWVPATGGVYCVHDLRGVLYVGRASNLQRRFKKHVDAPENQLLVRARQTKFGTLQFSWALQADAAHRAELERKLVLWLQPACNRALPSIPSATRQQRSKQ